MAIVTSYTTLLTAVGDYLARSDLTTFTPNFVQNFEERFYRDSQNWASWMETAFSSATASSGVVAVPAAYLGLKVAYISGQNSAPLKRINVDQLYQRYPRAGSSGVPVYIARRGANFEFGPMPSNGTELAGTYYAKPTVLRSYTTGGADAVAHFLIVNAPDLLLYGALLEAEPFLKNDSRLIVWASFYDKALQAYRSRFVEEEHLAPMMVAV
jgi:hypothetical protein